MPFRIPPARIRRSPAARAAGLRPAAVLLATALAAGALAPSIASAAPRFRPATDDVFYMYMPIAWRDSDHDTHRFGDFGGMAAAIPYLKSLGVTAVWMTPIFPSAAYHGYQHGPADQIAPHFGNETQFWSFVAAAHAESIKVFLDFVAYGVSQNTTWFQDSYANPGSVYDSWLAYTNSGNTSYLGCCPYTTWDGSTVGFIHWDLRKPEVTQMVTDWALHWLDPNGDLNPADGVDGFRLDHVSSWHPDESLWGYDLSWWITWNSAMRARYPGVITFAEQADWGSYGGDLLWAFDGAFTKPFEFSARDGLDGADARPIAGSMSATLASLQAGKFYLTTLGNHDVERLATRLDGDAGKLRSAATVLLLQPLPPVLYFGDELGMQGAKNFSYVGDAVDLPFREPFKWNAVEGPPMSNYLVRNAAAYAGRVSRDHDGRSVEEQDGVPGSLLEHYRALAALRHAHPALRRGDYREAGSSHDALWTFVKAAPGETLLVAINVGGAFLNAALDLSAFTLPPGGSAVTDAESGMPLATIDATNQSAYPLAVDAHGFRLLRVSLAPRDLRADYADANVVITQDSPAIVSDHVFELDQMFVRFDPEGLALGISGNLVEGGHGLAVFFDAAPGGQATLQTSSFPQPPSGLQQLTGMAMDAGFEPERVLYVNNSGGQTYVDFFTLASVGGGSKRYIGAAPIGGVGPLSGGDNPNGMRVNYSPWNRGGIAYGVPGGAETATDGFRILVPWADLGLAGAGPPLGLMAMLVVSDGYVFNQFLPGLQGRDTPLGYAPFDLGAVPGAQFATLSSTTDVVTSLVYARAEGARVELAWQVRDAAGTPRVERAALAGAWRALGEAPPDGDGIVRWTDTEVAPGGRYGYRLIVPDGSGEIAVGEAWVEVPGARLELRGATANPTRGPLRVAFELPSAAPATLELLDLQGRRVARAEVGPLGPGAHQIELGRSAPLAPGLYFLRLRQAGEERSGRVAVVK
jgi:glycosidase